MNTKTTLVLAIVAVAVASYVFFVEKPWDAQEAKAEPKTVAVALYEPKPADPDRVEVQRRDGKKLVLVKDAESKAWNMVEPMESPAPETQVKQLIDKVGEIKFDRQYGPNDKDRPSEKVSGLDKPLATVRLLKSDKELASVVIGSRLPTGKGNYLKVNTDVKVKVGEEAKTVTAKDVLESTTDLSDAFAAKIDSYRDKNVVKFDLNDVKRMTVEGDRNYVLVKNGDQWVLESPVRGRADKSKAEGVVRALTSLYVADFKDDQPASYTPYGLEPARMTVKIETEKTVPPKAKPGDPNTQPADIQPSKKQVTHEVMVGGPVDASGKQFFARLGGKPWVFSINDYTYKQLATDVVDLQDKVIASIDTPKVKSISSVTPDGSMTLTKQDGKWVGDDKQTADQLAVDDLLKAINGLQAVNFVDTKSELITVNWDKPRAKVSVVQEGSLNPITVLVGPPSASGKMVFVRNAAEEAVAAVREEAVAQLLAGPVAYRDRTVMKFDRTRANRLEIAQPGKDKVTLTQKNAQWSMVEPAAAPVERDAVRNLMQDLSNLQAKGVAGSGDLARFGLDKPAATVAIYVEPITADPNAVVVGEAADAQPAATKPAPAASTQPATTRPAKTIPERIAQIEQLIEYQKTNPKENPLATKMLHEELAKLKAQASQPEGAVSEAGASSQPAAVAQATKPAPAGPTALVLHLAQKDGKTFGAVEGGDMIYELDSQVFTDATAEMHDREVTQFETAQVSEVQFAEGENSIVLRKSGEDWKYALDSVLPIDKASVTKVLDELKDIKTHQYVSYKADNLAAYGLDIPARSFAVALDGGQRIEVLISAKGPEHDPDKSIYAMIAGQGKVFLLKPDQVTKFTHKLDDFEKSGSKPGAGAEPSPEFAPNQFGM